MKSYAFHVWMIALALLFIIAIGFLSYVPNQASLVTRTCSGPGTMNTTLRLRVAAKEWEKADDYMNMAREIVRELEAKFSLFNDQSDISRINQMAGLSPVAVSKETIEILKLCWRYGNMTRGCFDPTVGPLVRRWGFAGGEFPGRVPEAEDISTSLELVNYRHLRISGQQVFLPQAGMSIDLGGIGKGFAIDACWDRLRKEGASSVLIDLGGNIRCLGKRDHTTQWRIGVKNPLARGEILGVINLPGGLAVATSGNYEQRFTIEGRRYTHIIDPRTGYPVSGMAGVTVIAENAVEADALSTALFVLGLEGAPDVLDKFPSCHAIFVPDKNPLEVWVTPGFQYHFELDPAGDLNTRDVHTFP